LKIIFEKYDHKSDWNTLNRLETSLKLVDLIRSVNDDTDTTTISGELKNLFPTDVKIHDIDIKKELFTFNPDRVKKILIVNNSQSTTSTINSFLSKYKCEADCVTSGIDGLSALLNNKYDLLITTVEIGNLDGISLLNSLNSISKISKRLITVLISSSSTTLSKEVNADFKIKSSSDLFVMLNQIFTLIELPVKKQAQRKDLTNILYVDDDQDIIELVKIAFRKDPNLNVNFCYSAAEAVNYIKDIRNKVDLIISDVEMPIKSGPEMIKDIKKLNKPTPYIYLTAHTNNEQKLELIGSGASGIISKPIQIDGLTKKIFTIWNKINH